MLAYTTATDFITLPTGLEAAIYIAGLLVLMACPYLFLFAVDRLNALKQMSTKQMNTLQQKSARSATANNAPPQNNS
ncbi:MAG: hypothetical protein AAFR58_11525 [Cyanobacteria bacterium J06627_28]